MIQIDVHRESLAIVHKWPFGEITKAYCVGNCLYIFQMMCYPHSLMILWKMFVFCISVWRVVL
jgi:hypothetical protein